MYHFLQAGIQTITINLLPDILRNKDSQIRKYAHFIELNMRNIFLQELWRKGVRETSFKTPCVL